MLANLTTNFGSWGIYNWGLLGDVPVFERP
jgi:hypothetical protein